MYNLACCFAAQGRTADALDVVRAALENGFDDVASLKSDADLAPLRANGALDKLLADFASPVAQLKRAMSRKGEEGGAAKKKPWITW